MEKYIPCAECRHAKPDKKCGDKNWTAYECTYPGSKYYRGWLNVSEDGDREQEITWGGCPYGIGGEQV